MKNKRLIIIVGSLLLTAAVVAGCKAIGDNPTPPTSLEAKLFDIVTNQVPQIVTKTNTVNVTNVVEMPSTNGAVIQQTNIITQTNVVTQTNQVAEYQYTPKPAVSGTIQSVGAASGPFTAGWGTIAAGALSLLYGAWAHLRSTKTGNTALVLSQQIEALRDFILTLPQGAKIDTAVTQFLQQHQLDTGVAQEVLAMIKDNTKDPTAVGLAAQLQAAINELTKPTTATTVAP